ncbi:oligosaccharide flippase family protein [Cytophagaceae bacterium ABcell3]|nr:oligosaccharide flippase family protein [Cytophagaceae bacterium ABcell3]
MTFTFSGGFFTALLSLLLSPVITRLYAPDAYGVFSLFSAIVLNLSMLGTLRYTQAFVLPKNTKQFRPLFQLTILLGLIYILLIGFSLYSFKALITKTFGLEALGGWYFVIPFVVLLVITNEIVKAYCLRKKLFKLNAGVEVFSSLNAKAISVFFGYFLAGNSFGLIFSDIFSRTTFFIARFSLFTSNRFKRLFRSFSLKKIKSTFFEYSSYPKYVLPGNYINLFSEQLPLFVLGAYFSTAFTGAYGFGGAMLSMPMSLLARSFSSVFLQKGAEVYHSNPDQLAGLTLKLHNRIFYLGLLPISFLIVNADWLFSFVFSTNWEYAGVFVQLMAVVSLFKLSSTSIISVRRLYGKEQHTLYISIVLVVLRTTGLAVGVYMNDPVLVVAGYCTGNLIGYLINNYLILNLLKLKALSIIFKKVLLLGAACSLFYVVKNLISLMF